ncbi:MAG: non-canonical purine NTP pyrophosphatase, RdgB/HAM1 family [Omnitrophica bacterium RIFCSPHIGHO2_02_FULL_51_18]|nr:MAG: non-canonical purine NTP pyrophosphatase, RdgB/HAM1 family [Omnitrophica bacterium RIFCSPHIGHO2_02_FULL_51_18]
MKHTVVIGTKNKNKLKEFQALLRGSGVRVLSLKDFPGCKDVKEDGKTFEANTRKKARAYAIHTGLLTLADDSGLVVRRLKGKPGVYSARFAGIGCTYRDNNRKLLRLLKHVPASKRKAKFVSVIALFYGKKCVGGARGECRGRIAFEERGRNGFGYDPVFIPAGFSKTYAELSRETKNKISHRGKALRPAKKIILKFCRI